MIAIAISTLTSAAILALPRPQAASAQADGTTAGLPRVSPGVVAPPVVVDEAAAPWHQPGWIAAENALPGTTDWHIADDRAAWEKIRGYAWATSVDVGETVNLSVEAPGGRWRADAYRMGYYGGAGARLVWRSEDQEPVDQPDPVTDYLSGALEAQWSPSLTVSTDSWPPGMYLFKLTSDDGGATFVPLVVRDDVSTSDLLFQSAVTTWQAYNGWGGGSHYTGPGGTAEGRASVISFDRPYTGNGSGEFLGREFELIYFMERLGLDVSYWTDIDLHERGELARNHRAVVIGGHDEYYTTAMRRHLEDARDAGVNLAFFGANNVYRKIRLDDGPNGTSRRQTNFRSTSDPMMAYDESEVTVEWRVDPSNEPESTLTGSYYECNPVEADMVIFDPDSWIFAGTGVEQGTRWDDVVGNEYDRVTPAAPTPASIQVLAHSPVTCKGKSSYADMTYYTTSSGAGVFDAATFWLIPPLDDACEPGSQSCQIQQMAENILRVFAAGPAGQAHPSEPNLGDLGITLQDPTYP